MRYAAFMLIASLASCNAPATDDMPTVTRSTGRVTVERIGVVNDGIAYNDRRGIYLIRDRKTDTEYIGVSGVGIAETGSHQAGKTRSGDER